MYLLRSTLGTREVLSNLTVLRVYFGEPVKNSDSQAQTPERLGNLITRG